MIDGPGDNIGRTSGQQPAICDSVQRQAIEADMAAMPERAVAAKWEINRNQVQKHRNRCMKRTATAPTTVRRVAALRERIKTLLKREKAADKAGDFGEANRCSEAIDAKEREVEALQAGPTPKQPAETRWVIRYEDAQDGRDVDPVVVERERNSAIIGIREALGFTPEAARREPGQQKPLSLDSKLMNDLAAAVERHQNNERFIASAMRLCAILKRERLPADVEAEIDRLEGNNDGDTAILPGDDEAENQGAEPQTGENGAA